MFVKRYHVQRWSFNRISDDLISLPYWFWTATGAVNKMRSLNSDRRVGSEQNFRFVVVDTKSKAVYDEESYKCKVQRKLK